MDYCPDWGPQPDQTAQATPAPPAISSAVGGLNDAVTRLDDRIRLLHTRLEPVLRPPSQPGEEQNCPAHPVPLVNAMFLEKGRMDALVRAVEDILDRLEL